MRWIDEGWNRDCPPNEDPEKVAFYAKIRDVRPIAQMLKDSLRPPTKEELDYVTKLTNTKPSSAAGSK